MHISSSTCMVFAARICVSGRCAKTPIHLGSAFLHEECFVLSSVGSICCCVHGASQKSTQTRYLETCMEDRQHLKACTQEHLLKCVLGGICLCAFHREEFADKEGGSHLLGLGCFARRGKDFCAGGTRAHKPAQRSEPGVCTMSVRAAS